jgi:hypothetical protein
MNSPARRRRHRRNARQGRGIANRFVRGCALQCTGCQRDAGNRAEKLPGAVEQRSHDATLPNRLNVNVIAGLKSAPDCPHSDRTVATMVAPIATPFSNRRTASLARYRWIG